MNGEPPIDPPEPDRICRHCGDVVEKVWNGEKYVESCGCSDDDYADFD